MPSQPAALPANSSTLPKPSRFASRCALAAFIVSMPSCLSVCAETDQASDPVREETADWRNVSGFLGGEREQKRWYCWHSFGTGKNGAYFCGAFDELGVATDERGLLVGHGCGCFRVRDLIGCKFETSLKGRRYRCLDWRE
jgi:hypothetical protein